MGNEYAHLILNLIGVITLMFVLIFVLKKFKLSKYAGNQQIKIINVVPIGSKEKVILMEVNNAMILVGATPSHIETLYVFNDLETANELATQETAYKAVSLRNHSLQ